MDSSPENKEGKRPKPVRRTRRRNPRFRAFFQSLVVVNGFFDGEELVSDRGFRLPATLSSKSTIAPGMRGDFVGYLRSDPTEGKVRYSSIELVRLRGENDPHVLGLKDAGFVAGHVKAIDEKAAVISVFPDRRHKAKPFEVVVYFLNRRPKKLMRPGKLVCYRFDIDKYGLAVFQDCFFPPRPTKQQSNDVKPVNPNPKPRPVKAAVASLC